MKYLLDANVFIEAKNRYYGLDICPAFWDWLIVNIAQGKIFSIDKVSDEIMAKEDTLTDWIRELNDNFFVRPGPAIIQAMSSVSEWAIQQGFSSVAIATFMERADCYLVAQALVDEYVVVTLETSSASKKRIKIPNACTGLAGVYRVRRQMSTGSRDGDLADLPQLSVFA